MNQATNITTDLRVDGDILTAQVLNIPSTTDEQTISHNFGRVATGVQIIKQNAVCTIYVTNETENQITLAFSATGVNVNIRIW